MTCSECKYATIVEDSQGKFHAVCVKVDSPDFLSVVSFLFGGCTEGEQEVCEE